jgi:hypothetical protein
MSGEHAKR